MSIISVNKKKHLIPGPHVARKLAYIFLTNMHLRKNANN